ncbi:MAG: hypothetical protein K8S25_14960 [Alphaproteobacteria bacterium]|nr:hypothetical protein [Alphaproteobacteria bacterium]
MLVRIQEFMPPTFWRGYFRIWLLAVVAWIGYCAFNFPAEAWRNIKWECGLAEARDYNTNLQFYYSTCIENIAQAESIANDVNESWSKNPVGEVSMFGVQKTESATEESIFGTIDVAERDRFNRGTGEVLAFLGWAIVAMPLVMYVAGMLLFATGVAIMLVCGWVAAGFEPHDSSGVRSSRTDDDSWKQV